MQDLTTTQVRTHLAEFERIAANGAYDAHQRREARRGIRLYTAELAARQS